MNDDELIEQALYFAEKAPVFPCSATKAPLTQNGFYDASQDPDTVRRMFAIADARLVGMPTGEISDIAVLDIDMPKNEGAPSGFDWLAENEQQWPTTSTVKSRSNGRHFYFEHCVGLNSSQEKLYRVSISVQTGATSSWLVGGYEILVDKYADGDGRAIPESKIGS